MDFSRKSGILLHPTSLPGPYGRGDLGPAAYAFVDQLARAGQTVWQVLPLGPPGYGGSPYAAGSAFAGDAQLVSPELLVRDGYLDANALEDAPSHPEGRVSFEASGWRDAVLARAFAQFQRAGTPAQHEALGAFRAAQAYWLDEHALFVALKRAHGGGPFWEWPQPLRRHIPGALREARRIHHEAVETEVFAQFLFEEQWQALRRYAGEQGVEVLGDVPIFVARDSSDVWARPELFDLDGGGEPRVVAGVPPDAFSEDGQLWGNPLYDYAVHARTAYAWWIERVRRTFELADWVRIDHFRGFAGHWEIPARAETAREGQWVSGPGMELFGAVGAALGELAIVAEDLGVVTDDVEQLLKDTGFPGMRVLQFAFYDDDPEHPFKPQNHVTESVVYTGTHDNETTAGWFANLDEESRGRVRAAMSHEDPVWGLVEMALASVAFLAVVPAQDLLGLDNSARTNTPGLEPDEEQEEDGGRPWSWRLLPGQLDEATLDRLGEATRRHGR